MNRLDKYITQVRGVSYSPEEISEIPLEGYIPILKANNITEDGLDVSHLIYIDQKKVKNEQMIRKGDILLAASSGSKGIVGKNVYFDNDFSGTFGAFCKVVRPGSNIYSNFLSVFFKTPDYKRHIRGLLQGANINNLRNEDVDSLVIPEFSMPDQIRIATILNKAKLLIEQRKESIRLLNELPKSEFYETFAEFFEGHKVRLEELATITSGLTKGKNYEGRETQFIPYMRVANVQDGYLDMSEIKTIQATDEEVERYELQYGDVLLTEGGDPDKLGRGAVWKDEIKGCIFQNHIFRVRVDERRLNPTFLSSLTGSLYGKRYFLKSAKQTTGIASINSTQLKSFPVIVPPIELQLNFSRIVEKTDLLKNQLNASLKELENLYSSLSQRAFKGEINLSKIYLSDEYVNEGQSSEPKLSGKNAETLDKIQQIRYSIQKADLDQDNNVSPQFVANCIVRRFKQYHFSFEMLVRYLESEDINYRNYYSTDELNNNPHYDEAADLKAFIFSAIVNNKEDQEEWTKANPFIKLEQLFYDAEKENFLLRLTKDDYKVLEKLGLRERSGIYFSILS